MTEVLALIVNSDREDFYETSPRVRTHIDDVQLQVVQEDHEEDEESLAFAAAWTKKFPDETASRQSIHIKYAGQILHTEHFVHVDGARHLLPLPESSKNLVFDKLEYAIAVLFNDDDTDLKNALSQAEFKLVDRHERSMGLF